MPEIIIHPIEFEWARRVGKVDENNLRINLTQGKKPIISAALAMLVEPQTARFNQMVAKFVLSETRKVADYEQKPNQALMACESLLETAAAHFSPAVEVLAAEGMIAAPTLDELSRMRFIVSNLLCEENPPNAFEVLDAAQNFFEYYSQKTEAVKKGDLTGFVQYRIDKRKGEYHERGYPFLIGEVQKGQRRLTALNERALRLQIPI